MIRSRPFRLLLLPVLWSHALEHHTTEPQRRSAALGEDCELPCLVAPNATVLVLQWSRPDLESHGYLLYYRSPQLDNHYQHPVFKDRVLLRDPDLGHGDLSVVLKNVTHEDSGTYECRLLLPKRVQRRHTVHLTVQDGNIRSEAAVGGATVGGPDMGGATDRHRPGLFAATALLLLLLFCVAVKRRCLV